MKAAYVVCALLCAIVGKLVLAADGVPGKPAPAPSIASDNGSDITTATPPNTNDTFKTPNNDTTTAAVTTSSTVLPTKSPTLTTSKSPNITTSTTPIKPTTSTTIKPTIKSTTTTLPPSSTINTTTASSTIEPKTTPVGTTPSPSKDRHFDGLSFFGGIVLATCLMAISVFAWKFYKQCNEGNYRTL